MSVWYYVHFSQLPWQELERRKSVTYFHPFCLFFPSTTLFINLNLLWIQCPNQNYKVLQSFPSTVSWVLALPGIGNFQHSYFLDCLCSYFNIFQQAINIYQYLIIRRYRIITVKRKKSYNVCVLQKEKHFLVS